METFFQWVGIIVVASIIIYLILLLLNLILKPKAEPVVQSEAMPIMRPLPIPTRRKKYIGRVLTWVLAIRKWKLEEDWEFQLQENDGDPVTIVIPAGFEFDGASIPKPLWAVLSPVGLLLIPGLIHDYGYRNDQLLRVDDNGISPYRQKAGKDYWDRLFKNVGMSLNGFTLINYIAWLGVELGGWFTWWKYRRAGNSPATPPNLGA